MKRVRCTICRQQLPNLKKLKSHYVTSHSKIQIIKQVLKSSILNATPRMFVKRRNRKFQERYKTIYLHEKVQITYSDDTLVIEDGSSDENLIELTFGDAHSYTIPVVERKMKPPAKASKRKPRKTKKPKKLFQISIKKMTESPKSLHEHTGEFYECHCMEKGSQKTSSDTESGSETGRIFYCNFCGNGYQTVAELAEHENVHQYYYCRLCNKVLSISNHREHTDQHLVKIYVCYLCGFEFICKDVLMAHLTYHFEQQTFENILNMEQDYNMYGFCNTNFSSGDYYSNINNILFFLTYPYDHYYSRNMFMKVVCDICYQEFYIYDYERHLKIAHFVR